MTTGAVQVQPDKGADPGKPVENSTVVASKDGSQMRVQVSEAPKPEAKKGAGAAGDKPAGDRPTWLPEKFKSPEDLAAAYAELEKKQSKPAEKPAENASNTANTSNASDGQVTDVLKAAGLDRAKYDSEFEKEGKLSDESYAELAAKGFTRELVDGWIEGQRAVADRVMTEVFTAAGGSAESYTQMVQWAVSNLTKTEVDSYNKTMDSRDHAAILSAVKGLHARYVAANGSSPRLVGGRRPQGDGGDRFESTAQLTAAMGDKRYKTDPAYRREVEQKLRRSNIL